MRFLLTAALVPWLAACTAEGYAVITVSEVPIGAPSPEQAAASGAVLAQVDGLLRSRLPGLREWHSCDNLIVGPNMFGEQLHFGRWTAWVEEVTTTWFAYWIRVGGDRAPADHERDVLHGAFDLLHDGSWDVLPLRARRGLCDALWAEGHPEREALLVADAAMALDTGLSVSAGGTTGPWMSQFRELDWGRGYKHRTLLPQEAQWLESRLQQESPQSWVGAGCGVGLDWLLARRLLDRLGGEGLHALGVAQPKDLSWYRVLVGEPEPIPWRDVLAAADLGTDEDSWRTALASRIDRAVLEVIARASAERLGPVLAVLGRAAAPEADFDAMVAEARPELRSPDGAVLALAEVPEVMAELREAWDRQAPALVAEGSAP